MELECPQRSLMGHIRYSDAKNIDDFGWSSGKNLRINSRLFDSAVVNGAYSRLEEIGFFPKGTNQCSVIYHEMGHVISKKFPALNQRAVLILEEIAKQEGQPFETFLGSHL